MDDDDYPLRRMQRLLTQPGFFDSPDSSLVLHRTGPVEIRVTGTKHGETRTYAGLVAWIEVDSRSIVRFVTEPSQEFWELYLDGYNLWVGR